MRAEIQHHLFLAFSKDHGIRQSRHARADFDGATTGIVHDTIFEGPAVGVPGPTSDRVVYQGGPKECPNHKGHKSTPFSNSTCNDGSGDSAELHLL